MDRSNKVFLGSICRAAGAYLVLKHAQRNIDTKNVTRHAEALILRDIKTNFPDDTFHTDAHGLLQGTTRYAWTIHAPDGKSNLARGVPYFGVGIGLRFDGEMIAAAIYVPQLRQFTYAAKGRGAYTNGKRIRVSGTSRWTDSTGCLSPTVGKRIAKIGINLYRAGIKERFRIASLGAGCAHAPAVAAGQRDWWITPDVPSYDIVWPSSLIIAEAGGKATNLDGEPFSSADTVFVASNGRLHNTLLSIIGGR